MTKSINTQSETMQDSLQPSSAPDVFEIESYFVTYDACSRGRGVGRAHTFTVYCVRKNGRIIEDGLTRRQADARRRAIEKSRPASLSNHTAAESLPLPADPLLNSQPERN